MTKRGELQGKTCDFEGCARAVRAKGKSVVGFWCHTHYLQQWRGDDMRPIRAMVDPKSLTEKACKTCQETKPVSEFYKTRNTWQSECKVCMKARTAARYAEMAAADTANGIFRRPYTRRNAQEAA
jgi:hypothetical protein